MAKITNYNLYLDGDNDKEYVDTYSGPIRGKREIQHLVSQVEYYTKQGTIPIVVVFIPKEGSLNKRALLWDGKKRWRIK